jgi:hypothetical protein
MGHHRDLGLLILDHLLVQMGLVVPSESIHAQGAPRHLERHGEYVESQVMDL